MDEKTLQLLMLFGSILGSLGGLAGLGTFVSALDDRRKKRAEAGQADASAVEKYAAASGMTAEQNARLLDRVDHLEKCVDRLEAELAARDRLLAEWQNGIERLTAQLVSHDLKPVWMPQEKRKEVLP